MMRMKLGVSYEIRKFTTGTEKSLYLPSLEASLDQKGFRWEKLDDKASHRKALKFNCNCNWKLV